MSKNKYYVEVGRAIYENLAHVEFTRADVEDLARKVADRVPWERVGRELAVKFVAVGIKAAEAAGALYREGTDAAPAPTAPEAEAAPEAPQERKVVDVPPEDVIPPGGKR